LGRARDDYERHREEDRRVLNEANKARIRSLATDFPRLWQDPKTPDRERKRIVRLLLEDVTLLRAEEEMVVQVRFSGGATRALKLPRPLSAAELWKLSQEALVEIDKLLDHHVDRDVAEILNDRGFVTGTGKPFTKGRVKGMRRVYGLAPRKERLKKAGLLTLDEIAARLGLHKETVKRYRREGRLKVRYHPINEANQFMYEDPDALEDTLDPAPIAARAGGAQYE
jgi:hypothetical protein